MELSQYAISSSYICSVWPANIYQYWDWGRWASSPETSPIFDGSDTSMSGNGKKEAHGSTPMSPAQNGGGCVETGPFKKYVFTKHCISHH